MFVSHRSALSFLCATSVIAVVSTQCAHATVNIANNTTATAAILTINEDKNINQASGHNGNLKFLSTSTTASTVAEYHNLTHHGGGDFIMGGDVKGNFITNAGAVIRVLNTTEQTTERNTILTGNPSATFADNIGAHPTFKGDFTASTTGTNVALDLGAAPTNQSHRFSVDGKITNADKITLLIDGTTPAPTQNESETDTLTYELVSAPNGDMADVGISAVNYEGADYFVVKKSSDSTSSSIKYDFTKPLRAQSTDAITIQDQLVFNSTPANGSTGKLSSSGDSRVYGSEFTHTDVTGGTLSSKGTDLGVTTVTGGTLNIIDPTGATYPSTASSVDVSDGGILQVTSGGRLTVSGDSTFNGKSTLMIAVDANEALRPTGDLNLGDGAVLILPFADADALNAMTFAGSNIIGASHGVTGEFAQVFHYNAAEKKLISAKDTHEDNGTHYLLTLTKDEQDNSFSITKDIQSAAITTNTVSESDKLLSTHLGLTEYLDAQGIDSGIHTSEINTDPIINGVIDAVKDGISSANRQQITSFRSTNFAKIRSTPNMSKDNKIQSLMAALTEAGPQAIKYQEMRLWLSPYYSYSKSDITADNDTGSKSALLGVMMGGEYRSKTYAYTLGVTFGVNGGEQKEITDGRNKIDFKGGTFGIYHSKGLWDGGRYDMLVSKTINDVELTDVRSAPNEHVVKGQHKLYSDIIDVSTSHVYHFSKDKKNKTFSVRFNIGNTYSVDRLSSYQERLVSGTGTGYFQHQKKSESAEVYGGIGVRWNRNGKWRIRVTGVYEYGYEYASSGGDIRYQNPTTARNFFIAADNSENTVTHYLTLNATFLNKESGWKHAIGYNGALQKGSKSHSFSLKSEYRW